MNNTGFVILLLLALTTSSLGATREYHYVQLKKTWTEAQSYCRQNFDDLATIETKEDWAIVQILAQRAGTYVWIGLYDDINGWKWSVDGTYLYKDGTTGFGEWFSLSADNNGGAEQCLAIVSGTLYDRQCGNLHNSVCYDEVTNKYIAVTVPMSWTSAQSYCRGKYTDLTSMRSLQEKEEIMKVIDQSPWWIGAYRDSWTWSDQSKSTLRKWDPSQPSSPGVELCVIILSSGWHDAPCNEHRSFICSAIPMMMVLKVVFKTEESVALNNPLVQEAVLKNIEEQMKHYGAQQKFRLRWRKQPTRNNLL